MRQEVAQAAIKVSPPAAVSAAILFGLTLDDWVKLATLTYLAIQGGYLLWRWLQEWRKR